MKLNKSQLRRLRTTDTGTPNRVALAIALAGVTQVDVAEGAGFTQPYISDISRGRFDTITVSNARKLAQCFGCQIEDLFPARETAA
jgi:transcriptional regulator with XRE-family HTH domain